jgi:hypothetical protein
LSGFKRDWLCGALPGFLECAYGSVGGADDESAAFGTTNINGFYGCGIRFAVLVVGQGDCDALYDCHLGNLLFSPP